MIIPGRGKFPPVYTYKRNTKYMILEGKIVRQEEMVKKLNGKYNLAVMGHNNYISMVS